MLPQDQSCESSVTIVLCRVIRRNDFPCHPGPLGRERMVQISDLVSVTVCLRVINKENNLTRPPTAQVWPHIRGPTARQIMSPITANNNVTLSQPDLPRDLYCLQFDFQSLYRIATLQTI
ncbi:hypothetical protein J6590_001738 [Homalodisca vitripennis]|nr:hypothetical protein J6590_001738 [Homalodisca vitripennis]